MFRITCPTCSASNPECTDCGGGGEKIYRRCPAKVIDRSTCDLMAAYRDYTRGFWPAPGGQLDQARVFMFWIRVIEAERVAINERKDSRDAANRASMKTLKAMEHGE